MDILVATFNRHKMDELRPLFPGYNLLAPADLGISEFAIDENGDDYFQNALIKARALRAQAIRRIASMPTLADDSGLSVKALDGTPGIWSSRYGSKDGRSKLSTGERNSLLLAEMAGVADRACAFYCCLVLLYGEDRFLSVQETCPGLLADAPRGVGGFGYDPIVYLPELGMTVAELDPEKKAEISHRGKAALAMRIALDALRCPVAGGGNPILT
ncbi:MAG: non-canonical purine NTP pyrophosphatase [Spirochaetes bacterium]|nr:non-canonical purine NTP pyrophosphatase [Spirochaetota bacterium]